MEVAQLALALGLSLLAAQEQKSNNEFMRPVRSLGSDLVSERQEAYRRLSWAGPRALPEVKKALSSKDARQTVLARRLSRVITLRAQPASTYSVRLSQWIRDLGQARIEVREAAMERLFEAGDEAVPKAREAMESNDAEVRIRARRVVDAVLARHGSVWEWEGSVDHDLVRMMRKGIVLYRLKNFKKSQVMFEKAFRLKPNSDLVYSFIKLIGPYVVAEMMNSPDRGMQDVGRRLFELARSSGSRHP